jgi:hypothetical protein
VDEGSELRAAYRNRTDELRARDEPPDATARHRVGDDADRGVGHQPVAAHPPAMGVPLTQHPPGPPPSRVPSPGYAFPHPLTRVTIVI